MTAAMTEWEFVAAVQGWINLILEQDPSLPFSEARCEQKGAESQKRRDLTLLDKNRTVVLTGEIKLPSSKDGGTPYNQAVIQEAREKAARAGAGFFFTWNVNEFVLWETFPPGTARQDRNYKSWDVTNVLRPADLESSVTEHRLRTWLADFLSQFSGILRGTAPFGWKSPDEKFIEALESSLRLPVLFTFEELDARYEQLRFKAELDRWMREVQGWLIYDDPEGVRDNLERAAKFTCYAVVNRLVFHEALLKRYAARLSKLHVPEHIDTGENLRLHLAKYFEEAKEVTGDYETVFGEDFREIGNRLPFYSDQAVPHWRELINQIHEFDFSKLDYEIIGHIFERLNSPEERHKYGQFYTRVEVVDLINSFCLPSGEEKIMDPACGGGTFLVRAYARKRELKPTRSHAVLLSDLFGLDVSPNAAHLTTINLATRDLIDEANYPQIARSDFFDVLPGRTFLRLPRKIPGRMQTKGLGGLQYREVVIPPLDAVVGNPPYLRQEEIRRASKTGPNGAAEPGTKDYYADLVKKESGADLSGRSDIHCYFWPHAFSFLKEDGRLGLLTSSGWLDVEYGFGFQKWILQNFEISAVLESLAEPWFVGARVGTAVTILRRQPDQKKRRANPVRFVQLRRPLDEILAHDGTTAGAVWAADDLRDEILGLQANTVNERYRARLVRQGDLWDQGVQLGLILGKSGQRDEEAPEISQGQYYGGKWGVYLRAPDLWFELIDHYGSRFTPLGQIAEIRFGVKTGKDIFFFPKDVSAECLARYPNAAEFHQNFGLPRKEVQSGRVKLVKCGPGYGEVRPIEAKYLEPEVHSLMEIHGFTVRPEDCARRILLVGRKRSDIKDKYLLAYLKWGEERGFADGATCAARVTADREWYDLTGHKRGVLFWPMAQQYRHVIPSNDYKLICNHNLFDISPKSVDVEVLGGVLNSTWVVLSKYQFGRPVGVEGNLKTEVVDVNMMPVPDPAKASAAARRKVADAFARLKDRQALYFLSERRLREMAYTQSGRTDELAGLADQSELDLDDRRALDDAVLQMLGVRSKKGRQELIDRLYDYLREFFEWTRRKEEQAIINKKKAKRRGPARPSEIAARIFQDLETKEPRWLRRYDPDFLNPSLPYDVYELPENGEPEAFADLLSSNGVRFRSGKKQIAAVETKAACQARLLSLAAKTGRRGLVRAPHEEAECLKVLREFEIFLTGRHQRLWELIEERTADPQMQEKIHQALVALLPK